MEVFLRLLLMLALIGVGITIRQVGILTETRTLRLNAVAFYVAVPALIFMSTYDQRPAELASVELITGIVIVIVTGLFISWVVHRREQVDVRRSVAIVQSYHSNLGYIGLPLVSVGFGTVAAGRGSVILGVGALLQISLTTLLLVRINGTDVSVWGELRSLLRNPVIISLMIGLTVATVAWKPSNTVVTAIDYIALSALPLALLCVGASLDVTIEDTDFTTIGSVIGVKVLALPVIAYLVFTSLGADSITVVTGVVMFGAPTAVSTYIYVGELGGDRRLASTNILTTTIVGLVTVSAIIYLLN